MYIPSDCSLAPPRFISLSESVGQKLLFILLKTEISEFMHQKISSSGKINFRNKLQTWGPRGSLKCEMYDANLHFTQE